MIKGMACDNSQNPRLEEKDLDFMTAGVMLFLGRSYRGSKVYAEVLLQCESACSIAEMGEFGHFYIVESQR